MISKNVKSINQEKLGVVSLESEFVSTPSKLMFSMSVLPRKWRWGYPINLTCLLNLPIL